jgi:hypothetical protein
MPAPSSAERSLAEVICGPGMSVPLPKADITREMTEVCFGPKADMGLQ